MSEEYANEDMHFPLMSSNGGPLEDESFISGWNLAKLDEKLAAASSFGLLVPPQLLPKFFYKQLDLFAMRYNMIVEAFEGTNLPEDHVLYMFLPPSFADTEGSNSPDGSAKWVPED